jgi:hypothetical protein
VERLAGGSTLEEQVQFPDSAAISYLIEPSQHASPEASFRDGVIRVSAPRDRIRDWANSDSVGIYFDLPADGASLRVAIEKDLECVDAPPEERDPLAFPRN